MRITRPRCSHTAFIAQLKGRRVHYRCQDCQHRWSHPVDCVRRKHGRTAS